MQEKQCWLNAWVSSPKLPLQLKSSKPKCFRYPTEIRTIGDEVRKVRIDRSLTQWNADDMIGVHRGFFNELQNGHRENSIYVLHKATRFLGYVPIILNIDTTTVGGKLYSHRITHGYPLQHIAKQIGLDKSTLARFERGRIAKPESIDKIVTYLT